MIAPYTLHLVLVGLDDQHATFGPPPQCTPPPDAALRIERGIWIDLGRPTQLDVALNLKSWEAR